MTEPGEPVVAQPATEAVADSTELSERNKEAEDVTLLSVRVRDQLATEPDEYTELSSRHMAVDDETADATRLSRRAKGKSTAAPTRKPALPALPPGEIGGAVAERGEFGKPAEEYVPRAAPISLPPEPARATPVPENVGVQDPAQARARREAARHKRLITTAIVVGLTAAIVTAAIIWIIALLAGQE